ncbi:acyl-CoA thioesterase [Roseomonas eburnea]|uniref:Acyl-CoA thioesterase n=2 Tax=Neoroseomonas eburnea TaxID=1346889 RepID=A0A9X9XB66_9PROT|nr:thioesterase family protein [Neoroseomonas eburnea]MBR0680952.1 acyl-CoA thioesterase [Neoroseomonas eburnea]
MLGTLADYRQHVAITTRWSDNDAYGHINNVTYYSFFDTAVNTWLIRRGVLDIQNSSVIGLVVETGCRYFRPLAYPVDVTAGIRVARIGTSSVRYEVGIFGGEETTAAAEGHFIHVYVSRETGRPVPLPAELRAALETILATPSG